MGSFTITDDTLPGPTAPTPGGRTGDEAAGPAVATRRSEATVTTSPLHHTLPGTMPITRAKADQLFWLGRYGERVYTTLKRFDKTYDSNVDLDAKDFSELCHELDMPFDPEEPVEALVGEILYNRDNPSSVCSSMEAAFGNAILLRPELGTETSSYVELALIALRDSGNPAARLSRHRTVRDDLLAFWGSVEDGMGSTEAKALLFFGKYVERIDLWSRFGADEALLDRPVRKLIFYLGYVRCPGCLPIAGTLAGLVKSVRARGYGEFITGRLDAALEEIEGCGKASA